MPSSPLDNPGRFHTPEEAAKRYKVHVNTIYNWITSGLLGHIRPGEGRLLRISDQHLAEFEARTTEEIRRLDDGANGDDAVADDAEPVGDES